MRTVEELEERLSRPRPALVDELRKLDGDIVVLGAAGKMGPTLVRLATRAIAEAGTGARVIAVSRFSQPGSAEAMRATGAEVHPADLTDDAAISALPDAANVVFLVGAKFGSAGNEAATWATNTFLPGRVAQRYAGARMVALSTGNVYPLTPTGSGGPTEEHPVGPVGEYAMSCLGRERILSHFAQANNSPTALIRLNYAVEPRYGVLVDIGLAVRSGQPVDVTTGYVNVVWQGYANEVILRSLLRADVPPVVLNLTGPETISVRQVARRFAHEFGADAEFTGTEADTALLSNASRCHGLFGYPDVPLEELVELTAEWLTNDLPLLGKPTKFDVRDGKF
ncbi:NAD-dependent epimerase/dehydratase family protein [Phytoactinopolyspora limicola]|uniref:NAD-dependent epimerase/dehydratase family protein n=1 Tax=Phytoactinopolyspora limicola TaxID=2715536 RepID=UPI001A9C428B|nr:NAD(P)-dependent oxidoreductase [Phytoactinopolyspora limicola]